MASVTFDNATRLYPGGTRPAVDKLNLEGYPNLEEWVGNLDRLGAHRLVGRSLLGAPVPVAATAAVLLVGMYARAVLGSWQRAIAVAALQGAAYGTFFVLVRSEDHALLLGATTLFVALALVMFLTRRMDWSMGALRTKDVARTAPLPDAA